MPIQKQSFEDSLECPLSDQEILERQELDESEDYFNSALTDYQRNR
jgi:wobble nucleotide-excising tRNase